MRRMISAMLQDEGYEVALACDGRDGLAKARETTPELILTDYEMPEMDGPALCQELKADPELRPIPVLMLTTLGATESKVIGLNAGADDYIEKPRSPQDVQELFARIRAQLRIADLRAELAQRNKQLEAAQAKLALELQLARKVQLGLMPKAPKPRGPLKMAVYYQPANQLGGDVYDFSRPDGQRLGILVVDISGHGVNSALLSGVVKTMAAAPMASGKSPGEVLAMLDGALEPYFPDGYFCTGFYVLIDETTGAFEYAGVGHPPRWGGGAGGPRVRARGRGWRGGGRGAGPPDGGRDQLGPGESLLVYTDGLPEAMTPTDELFGQDRIIQVLEAHRASEPSEILKQLEAAVARHVAPGQASDDINLIVVQNPRP